jgi:hypothetical protein
MTIEPPPNELARTNARLRRIRPADRLLTVYCVPGGSHLGPRVVWVVPRIPGAGALPLTFTENLVSCRCPEKMHRIDPVKLSEAVERLRYRPDARARRVDVRTLI